MDPKKNPKENFPETPLERCHLRWFYLFDKILKILFKRDPSLTTNLRFTLYKFGLGSGMFEINPSDEILEKAKAFHEGQISSLKLKGKQKGQGESKFYPIFILYDYLVILSVLEDLPSRFRNPNTRLKFLKDRIPKIRESILPPYEKSQVPNTLFLEEQIPKKELAVRLLAHFYSLTKASIRTYLTRAKRIFPECFERDSSPSQSVSKIRAIAQYYKSQKRTADLDLAAISNWVKHGVQKEAFRHLL